VKQYSPQVSEWRERIKFYDLQQEINESISEWYARIRSASVNCYFGAQLTEVLKNKFVVGLRKGKILDRICEEPITEELSKLVSTAQRKESVLEAEINRIQKKYPQPSSSQKPRPNDNRQHSRGEHNPKSQVGPAGECKHCGKRHGGKCRFAYYKCNKCSKIGHLANICHSKLKSNNFLEVEEDLYCINLNVNQICNPFIVKVNIDDTVLEMEIDSGAAISCISRETYYNQFSSYPLSQNYTKLKSYTGHAINPLGYINVKICYKGMLKPIKLYVVEGGGPPLLGRDWLESFKIGFQSINAISNPSEVERVISKFPKVFSGKLGRYKHSKISLELKPDSKPIFCKPRAIPLALKELIDKELDRMIEDKVLNQIETSEWGTPLVPILKNDGTVRLCGDYKTTVNKHLVEVNYPLPRIEEMFAKLHGGQHFTKIDLNQAYTQFELDEDAKKLLTWSTHRGLFTVNRMPFGISPASAKFQKYIEQLFMGMKNVIHFLDDILITSPTKKEHLETLEKVLKKLDEAGLTVKKEKCKFFQDEVEYLGHIIDKNGLKKTKDKISAITEAPQPKTVTQVRSFCGMVNYYSRFVPNLAAILRPIYNLLSQDGKFEWKPECEKAFKKIKEILISDACLVHFDPKLPITLTTDASNEGISAVLNHIIDGEEKMVGCVSRTLMPAEKNYAVVHKEALAIYYGVTKFHQYLWGQKWILKTDHKPLLALFGENRATPIMQANRLQRWATYLSGFNYRIQYIRGKQNPVADCLSRVPRNVTTISNEYKEEGKYINFPATSNRLPIDMETIATATKEDKELLQIIRYVTGKWPHEVETTIKPYFHRRNKISYEKGVLLWGYRIIIPKTLREQLLNELHSAHFGMSRMKAQARTWLWWPSLDSSIEQFCKSCLPCLQTRQDPPRANPTPWPEAKTPYERVHIDYLGPIRHKMYLIITCAYSKWPEVYQVNSLRADELEEKLRDCFARWGIPKLLVSDNGRSLVATPTEEFLRRNKIQHRTSPPFHPQSNGAAENSVKTFKNKIKALLLDEKCNRENINTLISRFLISYRNTKHAITKETPAKLLIGRDLRTRLSFLKEGKDDQREIEKVKSENAQKLHRRFKVGDVVMARDYRTINKRTWTEAKILKQLGRTTYICRTKSGEDWKRHANQLIHTTLKAAIPEVTETKSSPSRITTSKIARNSVTPSTFQEQPILTPDPQPIEPLIHESPSPRPVRVRKPPSRLNFK
jgi:hypothetical protein